MRRASRFSSRILSAYSAAGLPETLAVCAAAAGQPVEILLYDEIGPWGITAKDMTRALGDAGAGPVRVRINSPGGDVFDGMVIYNALLAHPGAVECIVDGVAASAASVIALAGTTTAMHESSMMMIHNAWTFAVGDRHAMAASAGVLGKIDGQLAAIYSKKTGDSMDDISAMLDAETWMTAPEALAAKFADSVIAGKPDAKARAAAQPVKSCATRRELRDALADGEEAPAVTAPAAEVSGDDIEKRKRILRLLELRE